MTTTIASWNVNGIRAAARNGLFEWLEKARPDILCLQEIKAMPEQLPSDIINACGYHSLWRPAQRKGYSGVAAYVRQKPLSEDVLGNDLFDSEGRVQILEYESFTLINTYFPNSREAGSRLEYKLDFCSSLLKKLQKLRKQGRNLVICGDFNIAHTEIDLTNPRRNEKNPGYLPEERQWMSSFVAAGYTDTFRVFNKEGGNYTWWSYRYGARAKNIGWRIDYFCVNNEFAGAVKKSEIISGVTGSDHCPVIIEFSSIR